MRRHRQTPIGEALDRLLSTLPSGPRIRESLALAVWDQAVGPRAAAATVAESVCDGILHVRTKSSVWSQELSLLKPTIVAEINRRLRASSIRDIHFRPGRIRPQDASATPHPDRRTLRAVEMTDEDREDLRTASAALAGIDDLVVRAALSEAIDTRQRLRRWRLQNGWRACQGCGTAHRSKGPLCPVCRIPTNERTGPTP